MAVTRRVGMYRISLLGHLAASSSFTAISHTFSSRNSGPDRQTTSPSFLISRKVMEKAQRERKRTTQQTDGTERGREIGWMDSGREDVVALT